MILRHIGCKLNSTVKIEPQLNELSEHHPVPMNRTMPNTLFFRNYKMSGGLHSEETARMVSRF